MNCPICNETIKNPIFHEYLNREFNYLKNNPFTNMKIVNCYNCNFGFVDKYLSYKELDAFYKEAYRGKNPFLKLHLYKYGINSRAISQILLIKQYIHQNSNLKLLDIGAGFPYAINAFQAIFNNVELHVVEPSSQTNQIFKKRGCKTYNFLFNKINPHLLPSDYFDVILLSHVLEHYNSIDLESILRAIKLLLKENGLILIELPNSDFVNYIDKRFNDAPHLSFFSISSLKYILEKCGFDLIFLNTCCELNEERYYNTKSNNAVDKKKGIKARTKDFIKKLVPNHYNIRFQKIKRINIKLLKSSDFNYSGDRECIRALIKKG